ncbi:MAG: cob(I)yrinic acid a,c-diamide adenosyltransferase [Acidobacteria bacterium]|nr:cob(I)yrinic acid a,c-diamide adenosyltransferase [Acidobacteriota bacterium]
MKIYTKTGDDGTTSLFDGTRVSKAHPRVVAYGAVDELNAHLGLAIAAALAPALAEQVTHIQRDLFAVGARLADPSHKIAARVEKASIGEADVARLEGWIDALEATLPPLGHFILAGGAPGGAALHVARTVCRRAEADALRIVDGEVEAVVLVYLNRLSDLLFVMARAANASAGVPEQIW